jgi:predicted O-methyltransferase YrrM
MIRWEHVMPISRWPFARRAALRAASYLSARMARYPALRERMAAELAATGYRAISMTSDPAPHERMTAELRANGYHVIPKHYYSPIPDESDLGATYWDEVSELPGIRLDPAIPIALVEGPLVRFFAEFRQQFGIEAGDPGSSAFTLINGAYMAVDAHIYYGLVRHLKPRRIIEIGSGQSTRLAAAAARRNADDRAACKITAIEPYPQESLRALSSEVDIVVAKLQSVDLALFDTLAENDILFIDSTHVLREGNDVQKIYLEILPRLRKGIYVHVHDISLPERYPQVYFEKGLYWNEQYLLQAFLAFNDGFKIVWPGNWMMIHHRDLMLRIFPEIDVMRRHYPASEPTAFWMRVEPRQTE